MIYAFNGVFQRTNYPDFKNTVFSILSRSGITEAQKMVFAKQVIALA